LSRREVEVLRLVVAGKGNREIAERLFVSHNTVANHVRSILTKTNTANRTEAAAFAVAPAGAAFSAARSADEHPAPAPTSSRASTQSRDIGGNRVRGVRRAGSGLRIGVRIKVRGARAAREQDLRALGDETRAATGIALRGGRCVRRGSCGRWPKVVKRE